MPWNRLLFLPVLSLAFAVSGAQASSIAADHRHFQPSSQRVRTAKILSHGSKFKAPSSPDNWLGGAGNWSNGSDWSAGLPGSGSDVSINTGNDNVTLNTSSSINSLTLGGASGSSKLTSDGLGHTLSIAGALTVNQSGNLYLNADTASAGASFTNLGIASVEFASAMQIDGDANNSGTLNIGAMNQSINNTVSIAGALNNSGTVNFGSHSGSGFGGGMATMSHLSNASTGTLILQGSAAMQVNGSANNSGSISFGEGAPSLSITGAFVNAGSFSMNGDDESVPTLFVGGTLTNTSTGSLGLAGHDITVGTLVNQGQLSLEDYGFGSLQVNGDASNSGTITFYGTGAFIQMQVAGTLTNSAGAQITTNDFSTITAATLVNGGVINLVSGGSNNLNISGDIQNSGTLNAGAFGTIRSSSLTNTGSIQVEAFSALRVSGDVNNAGTIITAGPPSTNNVINITGKLTNTSTGTFSLGTDSDVANVAYVTNAGTVFLGTGTTMTVTGGAHAANNARPGFLNSGVVDISSGSTLSSPLTFTQTGGQTTVDGTLRVSSRGVINFAGGSVYGNQGTLQGSVISNAAFNIGDAQMLVGQMALTGNYSQGANGSLTFDIAGPAAGQYDQLNISGHAQLNGLLTVDLLHGFVPQVGNTFDIMNFAGESGTFSMVVGLPINGQEHFVLEYNSTNLTLDVVQGQLSELSGDTGTTGTSEPFVTASSEVEAYSLEASNHGNPSPTPEPSGILLFASGALGLGSILRFKR